VLGFALRALFLLARVSPNLAGRLFGAQSTEAERAISARPQVMRRALASAAEAVRQGAGGLVEDMRVAMRPWGFAPEEIRVPTFVWQGDADSSIPFTWGEWWEGAVPGARMIRGLGEGHLLVDERIEEILGTLTSEEAVTR
jgi:pimeloyl-ACP methyl ester carboxylesterase